MNAIYCLCVHIAIVLLFLYFFSFLIYCFFFVHTTIVVNILFYYDVYIILLYWKLKINQLILDVCKVSR